MNPLPSQPLLRSHPRPPPPPPPLELIIGVAVTAVVAAILAVLINSTAVGTNTQQDGRRALVKLQSMKAQLEDDFINSRAILATGTNYVVYWAGDITAAPTPVNGAVNLSELRLLELDTTTGNLNLYAVQWPTNFTSANIIAADQEYAATTSWYTACQTAKTGAYFVPTVLATSVTGLTASLDSATYTSAHMINVDVTFFDGYASRDMVLGATLQNPAAPW